MSWRSLICRGMVLTVVVAACKTLPAVQIEITAGEHGYSAGTTVVSSEVPRGIPGNQVAIELPAPGNRQVIAQRDVSSTSRMVWILEAPLAKGETRRYEVSTAAVSADSPAVVCEMQGADCSLSVQKKPVRRVGKTEPTSAKIERDVLRTMLPY